MVDICIIYGPWMQVTKVLEWAAFVKSVFRAMFTVHCAEV